MTERPEPANTEEPVRLAPAWVCDRCGATADGPEYQPFSWTQMQAPVSGGSWDLCPRCTVAYLDWLDEPARQLSESKGRQIAALTRMRDQISPR